MKGASTTDGAPKPLLAKALYDNHPDCSDELAFCRGDILTILEQNVPESEGWWKCLLHGRQGLAPANRLQVLPEAPTDRPCAPLWRVPGEALASSEETCAPTLLSPPPSGPIYEQMKSWVEGTLPPTIQVYEFPDPPACARIVYEKTLSFPKQAVFTIPRPAWVSLPAPPSPLYDVPKQSRSIPAPKEPAMEQQLYDIPASPRVARHGPHAGQPNRQSAPVASTAAPGRACYKTLPNPQKSEWIYDTPVSPGKADARCASQTGLVGGSGPLDPSRYPSSFHSPPNGTARSLHPHLHKNVPTHKKLSLPEISSYSFLTPREEGGSYKVPSSFRMPRVEKQNTQPNIYDIPKAASMVPQAVRELGKADGAPESSMDLSPSWFCRRVMSASPEPDTLSVNSSDRRVSVVSSCSSMSTDSSSSSFSEESVKEVTMDLDLAKRTVTALQHKVSGAVTGLMLFVSRTWRFKGHLEANIDAIHRAADHVEDSLREFLEFAHEVCGTACNLTDSNLQARMRGQLQTISNSYQTLLEAKGSLDSCNWSLEVLVMDKVQNNPDDLERFVMVARMVPEDIKRFASIVIANGKLLFKHSCEREETVPLAPDAECKLAKCIQLPRRETESHQRSAPFINQRESEHSPELLKGNCSAVCAQKLPNIGENENPISEQRSDGNKDFETQKPSSPPRPPVRQQDPEKKIHLSKHCRLYFGALFKAIGVFTSSLSHNQPPESFIAQSKLIIMVGQKLVDTLCKETQDRDARNEILCCSSHLCGLLKDLALATKQAVLKYPSPTALGHLQAEARKLEQHTRQLRGTLE